MDTTRYGPRLVAGERCALQRLADLASRELHHRKAVELPLLVVAIAIDMHLGRCEALLRKAAKLDLVDIEQARPLRVRISLDRLRRLLTVTQSKTADPADRPCRIGIRRRERRFAKVIGDQRFEDDRRSIAATTSLKARIGEVTTQSLTSCALSWP